MSKVIFIVQSDCVSYTQFVCLNVAISDVHVLRLTQLAFQTFENYSLSIPNLAAFMESLSELYEI